MIEGKRPENDRLLVELKDAAFQEDCITFFGSQDYLLKDAMRSIGSL